MNQRNADALGNECLAAVAELAKKAGLTVRVSKVAMHDTGPTIMLRFEDPKFVAANDEIAALDFKRYAAGSGLAVTDLHAKYAGSRGSVYEIVGWDAGRPKNPIKLRRADGKTFICAPSYAKTMLDMGRIAA